MASWMRRFSGQLCHHHYKMEKKVASEVGAVEYEYVAAAIARQSDPQTDAINLQKRS